MFTGIVEDLGELGEVRRGSEAARLTIKTSIPLGEVAIGDSISVDGACLTVVSKGEHVFDVDAAVETLAKTTLGDRQRGDALHLERAMRLGDRLGGHLVTGHVDGMGSVAQTAKRGPALEVTYRAPAELMRYVIVKGSIAVDGASLTVNRVHGDTFSVVLIPHTLENTHLGATPGTKVNLETDLIGKYVERLLQRDAGAGIDLDLLKQHGYAK